MRKIEATLIRDTVRDLCIRANRFLPEDLSALLEAGVAQETEELPRQILCELCKNRDTAAYTGLPICQDTGMAVVFLEIGQDVHITGGDLTEAVDAGVSAGYREGNLRCSVVRDPLRRENTGDNTPAVLHVAIVPGDRVKVMVAPKGFGSENMSRVEMLTPAADRRMVIDAVCRTVREAGSNPCPPVVLGIGLGGDFEQVAYLAKKALCRPVSRRNPDPYYAALEQEILDAVNGLGVGPQGFGGKTTALAVMIETAPTHIAGLPLAVNVGCHVTRHAETVL